MKYIVYEVFQHPSNKEDVGLEKIQEFFSEESAREFVNSSLDRNMIIEVEGDDRIVDEHEDMWNDPYGFGLRSYMHEDAD
jgi:hypothetical protein